MAKYTWTFVTSAANNMQRHILVENIEVNFLRCCIKLCSYKTIGLELCAVFHMLFAILKRVNFLLLYALSIFGLETAERWCFNADVSCQHFAEPSLSSSLLLSVSVSLTSLPEERR